MLKFYLTKYYRGGVLYRKGRLHKKVIGACKKIVRLIIMSNISRRQFLKGAGVATLAVAAAGVLAGCSGPDVPDVPGVTTRPVTVIFMKDEGNGVTNVVGETAKIDVLKTENSVRLLTSIRSCFPKITIWRTRTLLLKSARTTARVSTSSSS